MPEDVVKSLGFLCLGSRFKRIGERLQADTQQIMDQHGISLQAGQYPFLAALDRCGPLSIGELAEAVGITQPGATRTMGQLVKLGLVVSQSAPEDQRRKVVSLTDKGQELVDFSKRIVWPRIEQAMHDLCGDMAAPILDQLAAIEHGLESLPLRQRALECPEDRA